VLAFPRGIVGALLHLRSRLNGAEGGARSARAGAAA
jgi:hypothetical protein